MSDCSGSDSEADIDTLANQEYQGILPKDCFECLIETGLSAPAAQPLTHSDSKASQRISARSNRSSAQHTPTPSQHSPSLPKRNTKEERIVSQFDKRKQVVQPATFSPSQSQTTKASSAKPVQSAKAALLKSESGQPLPTFQTPHTHTQTQTQKAS